MHKLINPKRILDGILLVSSMIMFTILWFTDPLQTLQTFYRLYRPSTDSTNPLQDQTYWNKTCTPKKDFCEHFGFDNFAGGDCTNSSSKTPISGVGTRGRGVAVAVAVCAGDQEDRRHRGVLQEEDAGPGHPGGRGHLGQLRGPAVGGRPAFLPVLHVSPLPCCTYWLRGRGAGRGRRSALCIADYSLQVIGCLALAWTILALSLVRGMQV